MNEDRHPRIFLTRRKKLLFLTLILVVCAVVAELGFRVVAPRVGFNVRRLHRFQYFAGEGKSPNFAAHPYTVFTRQRGPKLSNALGFADDDWTLEKRPDTVRIACVGASTTEGGNNQGDSARYPRQLEEYLGSRHDRPVEVMNWGLSGWTSAETLVNYVLNVQDYKPDLILIHHAINDVAPRNWPGFRSDYSHYRTPLKPMPIGSLRRFMIRWSRLYAWWEFQRYAGTGIQKYTTTPVRKGMGLPLISETTGPFRRNIRTICELADARGTVPVLVTMPFDPDRALGRDQILGIQEHNRITREIALEHHFPLVDLEAGFQSAWEEILPHFIDIVHLDRRGNRFKARLIGEALLEGDLLDSRFEPHLNDRTVQQSPRH